MKPIAMIFISASIENMMVITTSIVLSILALSLSGSIRGSSKARVAVENAIKVKIKAVKMLCCVIWANLRRTMFFALNKKRL